jgi:RND family efflux transporter MFP subunit
MNAKNANKSGERNLMFFLSHSRSFAFIGGLILLLAACSSGKPTDEAQPPVEVGTATPTRQTFHAQVAAFGQLAADSRNALSLSLPQAGEVTATEAIAGQRVKRGEALLKLTTDPATRSAYLQTQSAVTVARDDLVRTTRLQAEKLATNSQLDAARKALADAQAALEAQAKLGGEQVAVTLQAPADGVVMTLNVQRGQRVAAGTTLLQFTPDAALAAQLGIDPGTATEVHAGMPVTLKPVYATHGVRPLHATVAMIGNAVNPQTHLIDVVATLDAPTPLAAGTALSANIATTTFTAWAVPRDALQSDAQGSYVFQIEQGKAHRVDVKVLAPDGSPVGVEGALDPQEPVITLGSYEVSDGDAVTATSAAAPQAHGAAAR